MIFLPTATCEFFSYALDVRSPFADSPQNDRLNDFVNFEGIDLSNYRPADLKLAARVAVQSWNAREKSLCQQIQTAPAIEANLARTWLNYWMLARTAPLNNRAALCLYLSWARNHLNNLTLTSPSAYVLVQQIANAGAVSRGLTGRPLSLISKLAFSCQPELFSPYDSRARLALKILGGHITNGDYPAYMAAFNFELAKFKKALKIAGMSQRSHIFGVTVTMNQSLFELRTFDKYLMLRGEFSRVKMQKIANRLTLKQHANP